MKIGIIGSGHMGMALGNLWSRKHHQVMFSYSKDDDKLTALSLLNHNTSKGTVKEAILFGEIIMLALPFSKLASIYELKENFQDKIVITCVSGLQPDFSGEMMGLSSTHVMSVAEQIDIALPSTKVVEAFNTTFAEVLVLPQRVIKGIRPTVFYCGDDMEAKKIVAGLIEDCDYIGVNAGNLRTARAMETFATSWVQFAVVAGLFPRIAIHSIQY